MHNNPKYLNFDKNPAYSQFNLATSPNQISMKSSMMANFEKINTYQNSPRPNCLAQQSFHYPNPMAKSFLKKQETINNAQLANNIKKIEKELLRISQTLTLHEQQLSDKWCTASTSSTSSTTSNSNYRHDTQENAKGQDLEKEIKRILSEDSIFRETYVRREEFEYFMKKLEMDIFNVKRQISKEFSQIKERALIDRHNLLETLSKDFDIKINRIHEASRDAFKQTQLNFLDVKSILQSLKIQNFELRQSIEQKSDTNSNLNIFVSNKKFHDGRQLKYKEYLVSESKQILINEVTYYLDKDGYLLDRDWHYLLDRHGRQLQLKDKQLGILKANIF